MSSARLNKYIDQWVKNSFPVELHDAPEGAVTFDTMVIVRSGKGLKSIKRVAFYDSEQDQVVAEF